MACTKRITFGNPIRYYLGDREVTEAEFRAETPDKPLAVPQAANASIWQDFTSEALSCHPDQVAEMNERNKAHGIGARYDKDGTCHIPDRADRKRLNTLEGYHDKDGGYGD